MGWLVNPPHYILPSVAKTCLKRTSLVAISLPPSCFLPPQAHFVPHNSIYTNYLNEEEDP